MDKKARPIEMVDYDYKKVKCYFQKMYLPVRKTPVNLLEGFGIVSIKYNSVPKTSWSVRSFSGFHT